MIEQERVRNHFLGEIETKIVGRQYHKAKVFPGEQINLERQAKNAHDRRAILVENGQFDPVGYLPGHCFLADAADRRGQDSPGRLCTAELHRNRRITSRCPLALMVFQCEEGHRLLERAEPTNELEALHQTVLHAYQDAQGYCKPELILGLAKGLQPLEKQELLPETRLLLALLPRLAHEAHASQGMRTLTKFRELLGTLTIGQPAHHHNLTFFPLLWPEHTNRPTRCSVQRLRKVWPWWKRSTNRAAFPIWP